MKKIKILNSNQPLQAFSIISSHFAVRPSKKYILSPTLTATEYESGESAIKLGPVVFNLPVSNILAS